MRKILIFFVSFNFYAQSNLREIVNHINEINIVTSFDSINYTLVNNSFSLDSIFFKKKIREYKKDNSREFNLYSSKNDTILEIINKSTKYYASLINYNNIKIFVFNNRDFMLYGENGMCYIHSYTGSDLAGEDYFNRKIENVDSLHFLSYDFTPINSRKISNEYCTASSNYVLKKNYVEETLYLGELNEFCTNGRNIMNLNINLLIMVVEFNVFTPTYRKIKVKLKKEEDLFWFKYRDKKQW